MPRGSAGRSRQDLGGEVARLRARGPLLARARAPPTPSLRPRGWQAPPPQGLSGLRDWGCGARGAGRAPVRLAKLHTCRPFTGSHAAAPSLPSRSPSVVTGIGFNCGGVGWVWWGP